MRRTSGKLCRLFTLLGSLNNLKQQEAGCNVAGVVSDLIISMNCTKWTTSARIQPNMRSMSVAGRMSLMRDPFVASAKYALKYLES